MTRKFQLDVRNKDSILTKPMTTKNAPTKAAKYRGVCSVYNESKISQ